MKYEDELQEELQDFQDPDDIGEFDVSDIVVYSRDWTIGTFYDQIEQGNIELNPGFQRRNAWDDGKRGKLIESILRAYPIPEIVLAEDKNKRGSFIVIDGKQRLLTIAGFINHQKYCYWTKPVLKNFKFDGEVKNYTIDEIRNNLSLKRSFENSSLRCTVITNYKKDDVLYDIFYRLNAGSSPLSSQELRQALNPGPYSNYLVGITNEETPLRRVMGLKDADKRLRDIEVLLRLMSFLQNAKDYRGNLRLFLDNMMRAFNKDYIKSQASIEHLCSAIMKTIEELKKAFGDYSLIGRRYRDGSFEPRFNRVILEVQVYYFCKIPTICFTEENNKHFVDLFIDLCENDASFRASVERSTKNIDNYRLRYTRFQDIVNKAYGSDLNINPFSDANISR